jgi:dolichol-phosphate mannosyltransferase
VTVEGIRFRRNFGKAAALMAGSKLARCPLVMTLDADLQDDPHEISRFIAKLADEYDVVSGYKQTRYDPWHKVYPSRIFNWMISSLTGVKLHDHNCGMKCYRREVFDEVRLYGELHRFVPVLAAAKGFRIGELVIQHRPRRFGYSKYGVRRFVKGFLDLLTVKFLTGFAQRPLHVLGSFGLASFVFGGLGMSYLAAVWVVRMLQGIDPRIHQRPLLLYSVAAFLLGVQLMSSGFLAELIAHQRGNEEDTYSIAGRTSDPKPAPQTSVDQPAAPATPAPSDTPQSAATGEEPR